MYYKKQYDITCVILFFRHYPDIDGEKTQRFKIESIGGPTLIEESEKKYGRGRKF